LSGTKTTVIAALVLVLTFAGGFAAGFVVHRFLPRERMMPALAAHAMLDHLDRRLDLTDAQRKQIEEILERRHSRISQLWSDVRPRVRAEIDATNAEIEKVLTPEQRAKFATMKMHLGGRRAHREGRGQTAPTR